MNLIFTYSCSLSIYLSFFLSLLTIIIFYILLHLENVNFTVCLAFLSIKLPFDHVIFGFGLAPTISQPISYVVPALNGRFSPCMRTHNGFTETRVPSISPLCSKKLSVAGKIPPRLWNLSSVWVIISNGSMVNGNYFAKVSNMEHGFSSLRCSIICLTFVFWWRSRIESRFH